MRSKSKKSEIRSRISGKSAMDISRKQEQRIKVLEHGDKVRVLNSYKHLKLQVAASNHL